MKHIFELRMKDQIEERSSQLLRNLSSCEKKAWKKFRLERDPVGLIAQLVEHSTGIVEVMGSNPVQAWIFFRLSFRNCLSCVVTARIFLLFDLSSAVRIYVSYIYIQRLLFWHWDDKLINEELLITISINASISLFSPHPHPFSCFTFVFLLIFDFAKCNI